MYKNEGHTGNSISSFVGTLWSIWKLRNEQVFREIRPSINSIQRLLLQSDQEHKVFIAERSDPSRNPRDPTSPPGFNLVHLGKHTWGAHPLTITIHAVWDKCKLSTGFAWVLPSILISNQREYGGFSYASSALAAEAMTCRKALSWAQQAGHMNLTILTQSGQLLQILRSKDFGDISIKWTIEAIRTLASTFNMCQVSRVSSAQIAEAKRLALWWRRYQIAYV